MAEDLRNGLIKMEWKKIRDSRIGNNITIIHKKKNLTLELFRDSQWGKGDNMNVIVRDSNKESYESSLGKSILVKHFNNESQALWYVKEYMGIH